VLSPAPDGSAAFDAAVPPTTPDGGALDAQQVAGAHAVDFVAAELQLGGGHGGWS